jgi:hypothetical protein
MATKRAAPVDIDMDVMRGPILKVWSAIAGDLDDACAEDGGGLDNTSAVEACIDADRMTFFADKYDRDEANAAEVELRRAIDAFGYDRVLRKLARELRLV